MTHRTEFERAVVAELQALREQIAEIAARLPERRPRQPGADRRSAALLAPIAAVVEDRVFSVAELIERGRIDDDFLAALDAAGASNARRLGKALQRMAGADVGDWRLERVGSEHGRALWRVSGGVGFKTTKPPRPLARARQAGALSPRRRPTGA